MDAGKQYFNGAGKCASCHSPTGDLSGIAARFEGLKLEERMLYPRGAKSKVTVTLASGQSLSGELAYLDEFTVAMRGPDGRYRSWRAGDVKYTVDAPAEAHAELLGEVHRPGHPQPDGVPADAALTGKASDPMKLPAILVLALLAAPCLPRA